MMVVIGIPRALNWYYNGKLWQRFLENLGFKVVVSDETSKQIVEKGVQNSDINLCFAMKIYIGHYLELQGKVDKIFVPSTYGDISQLLCPYHRALPSIVKSSFSGEIINIDLELIKDKLSDKNKQEFAELARLLGKNGSQVEKTLEKAFEEWKESEEKEKQEELAKLNEKGKIKIAIVGSKYILKDKFCIGDIKNILKQENAIPIIMQPEKDYEMKFNVKWELEQEVINQYMEAVNNKNIDGIIYLAPFTCGPLFLIEEQVLSTKKKIVNLKIDESQSETRLKTRIEAFIDLIKRNHISRK